MTLLNCKRWIGLAGSMACVTACLLIESGCSPKPVAPTNIIAKVGSYEITVDEFKQELEYRRVANRPVISKEALLQELINQKALLIKARQGGFENDPELRRTYENLLVGKVKETELNARLKSTQVTAEEVKQRYEQTLSRYTFPGKVHLALLVLKTTPTTTPEQLAILQARLEEARKLAAQLPAASVGFGALAVDYSEDQASRYRGGDVGWYDTGEQSRWPSEVFAAATVLKNKGEISDVITTEKGLYLVTKMDSRASTVKPLDEVADAIRRQLLTEKQQFTEQTFLAETRRSQSIVTNLSLLEGIPFSASMMAGKKEPTPPTLP